MSNNVATLNLVNMPSNSAAFAALFAQKPKMLTDEVQSCVTKAYDGYDELRNLIGADNDADAVEGSIKDNIEGVVTILREYSQKYPADYPLAAKATRRQLRHAYMVVRRRIFAAMQASNALSAPTQAAE